MEEESEWNAPGPPERPPVAPEQQDRFRRLITELMFCLVGAPVFGFAAAWIRPPLRFPGGTAPPRPEWEALFYRWIPLVLSGLSFICVAWLVIVLMRLGSVFRKPAENEPGQGDDDTRSR
jgi:hypothetical protein